MCTSQVLNIEEDNGKENDLEMADLRKQGIAPIPKPPPGVGLLPTPGPGSPPDGSKKIPSLFEIKVQPTVGLAQKISLRPTFYNSTSPTTAQFQGAPQFPGNPEGLQAGGMMSPPPSSSISPHSGPLGSPPLPFTGPGIPQSPPAQPSPHGFPIPPPCPPPGFHSSLHQMIPPPLNQQGASFPPLPDGQMNAPFQKVNQMSSDFFRNLFSSQTLSHADEGPAQEPQTHGNTDSSGMQDLLPALLLHLNQNRQDSDSQREEQQGSASSSKDKDDTPNWYSSDEEEGSGVKAILNTLKKQNEMLKNQPSPATADPRLQKERALPSDPRTKPDPRQRPPDLRKEDGNGDPRTVHRIKPLDVSKHDHHPNPTVSRKPALGEDDDESERELRERTAFIPLDPNPGIKLRDPRCQIKQFSHIRVDILLQRPTFAQSVVWGPEDLIPSLIPKQEHSINLPLPPLIADAQLNRSLSSPPDHPPSATLSPPNPRLAAASFKEGIGRIGSPPGRLVDARHQDKPVDPRSLKTLDPRINRSASLDSKPPKIKETRNEKLDPRLKRASTNQSVKSESEKLPPYAPRLALSSGPSLENPTTLLGGISLYDPRNHSLLSPKHDNEEQPTKGILKSPPNPPPHDSQPQESALDTDEKSLADDSENNKDGCPSVPLLPTGISPCSQIGQAAPAVHNLPIQALAGIIRPAYNDPRQNKPVSTTGAIQPEDEEDKDSKKDRPLRDVFKTFDPTASPFFQ
ncbi:hypothetical protein DNTS_004746 [Danionella cerebrum]|uniref:Zinc finger CCCH domain-containing protein 6 n=1 Tax=Danionella cerebrum TaxID=2873325 RepID=A0A553R625_9TELE|nr:hypothetical protein DNTS_004746 [Danionella translucida]TRY97615.1 hypothetical protein DNTS_004746 [Danionella translucida]